MDKETKPEDKYIIGEVKISGENWVNVLQLSRDWNHLFSISQWNNEYTLVKMKRKDSPIREFKTKIHSIQAEILIGKLSLVNIKSGVFRSGSTWKSKI